MIYERKDRGCKAKVLAVTPERVLITAFWPAKRTEPLYDKTIGMARNTLNVSRRYFEEHYRPLN